MSVAAKLSSIAGISLKPVVNGAVSGPSILSESLWDIKEPLIIFVARRPGCILCREHAVDLTKRLNSGDFQNAKLVGIIKEVAPVSGAATDEELGVSEFQNKFFEGHPVYLDEKKSFYEAFGNQSLLAQKWHTWNPFQLYRDYKTMKDRLNEKKVAGNLKGEGFLKGGIFIISKEKDTLYSYPEITGSVFDYDDMSKKIASLNEGLVISPVKSANTSTSNSDKGEGTTTGTSATH